MLQDSPTFHLAGVHFTDFVPIGIDQVGGDSARKHGCTGQGARVAVVDTGIAFNHQDLRKNVDQILSRNFTGKYVTKDAIDKNGHGTHCAGIIAAERNDKGLVGLAPEATLISLKILNANGSGTLNSAMKAINYISTHNENASNYEDMIHVANLSIGAVGSDRNTPFRRAIERCVRSGCFIVVAAGNANQDAKGSIPACYDSVFTVSAFNPHSSHFSAFSNYGYDIDMTAPGTKITSTFLNNGYVSQSGTSMAAPHVAGAAALYVSQNMATLTKETAVRAIRKALLKSGDQISRFGDKDNVQEKTLNVTKLLLSLNSPTAESEPSGQKGASQIQRPKSQKPPTDRNSKEENLNKETGQKPGDKSHEKHSGKKTKEKPSHYERRRQRANARRRAIRRRYQARIRAIRRRRAKTKRRRVKVISRDRAKRRAEAAARSRITNRHRLRKRYQANASKTFKR